MAAHKPTMASMSEYFIGGQAAPKRIQGQTGRALLKRAILPGAQPKQPLHGKPVSIPSKRTSSADETIDEATLLGSQETIKAKKRPPNRSLRKEPTTIDELVAVVVKHAIRRDDGLTVSYFDANFMPRIKEIVPAALKRMEAEVINEYLVDLAHSIYIAITVGKFNQRPTLCGVRASELAADLLERVIGAIEGREDKRITAIRSANLLVGLTFHAVRFLESTKLEIESLEGFTDNYERSVITTYGLKTQSEATGQAPWIGPSALPLDNRISKAINTMSSVFANHIGEKGIYMDDASYDRVLREFDSFTEKFAPYIDADRMSAGERRKKLSRGSEYQGDNVGTIPLNISEVHTRPAGLELKTTEGKSYFISTDAARQITSALLSASAAIGEELQKYNTQKLEKEPVADPAASSNAGSMEPVSQETSSGMSTEDAQALADIKAQMQQAKKSRSDKPSLPAKSGKNPVRNPFG